MGGALSPARSLLLLNLALEKHLQQQVISRPHTGGRHEFPALLVERGLNQNHT